MTDTPTDPTALTDQEHALAARVDPDAPGLWLRVSGDSATLHHVVRVFGALYVAGIVDSLSGATDFAFTRLPRQCFGVGWRLTRQYGTPPAPPSVPDNTRLYAAVCDDGCVYVVRCWVSDSTYYADMERRMARSSGTERGAVAAACSAAGLSPVFVARVELPAGARR